MEQQSYYVNLYMIDQGYGGQEEGGWTYIYGEPLDSELNMEFSSRQKADEYAEAVESVIRFWNKTRPEIYSVLSEGRYAVYVQNHEGKFFPEERPHYE